MPSCPFCAEEIPQTSSVCPYCNADLAEARRPARRSSQNSTATVWIVVLSIVAVMGLGCAGVVVAVLLPAVQTTRGVARRTQSRNNLKQIAISLHNYHDVHTMFTPGGIVDESGKGHHGWLTFCLPYMDQAPLYNRIDFERPWDDPTNLYNFQVPVLSYVNPAIPETTDPFGYAVSHYAGNAMVMKPNHGTRMRDVTDGTSNTMLGGEVNANFQPWGHPENYRDPVLGINASLDGFGSPFEGGANIMMMDGSVRFVNDNIDPAVLKAISTPDGGETVALPF